MFYEIKHPDTPLLNRNALSILASYLKPSDEGLEWGSGRSTVWLAKRVRSLTSVEHDSTWYTRVTDGLREAGLTNVRYLLREDDSDDPDRNSYISVINEFADKSLDFVLVDGGPRCVEAIRALSKIRPGGILILDDANTVLSCDSFSPGSRSKEQGPRPPTEWEKSLGAGWAVFTNLVADYRCIWASDGVFDTAIFLKPPAY